MAQDLGRRIRQMAEYTDAEHIAKAVRLPVDIVEKVLSGEIPDEALLEYDPKRTDVRLVETKRFVRSRVVGVLSPGGCGATTLTASLALFAAQKTGLPVAVVDLNEHAHIGTVLGLNSWGDRAVYYPNVLWWAGVSVEDAVVEHPEVKNLHLVLGAPTVERRLSLSAEAVRGLLDACGQAYSVVLVDCPSSPNLWGGVLPPADFVLVVLRADEASVVCLWQMLSLLQDVLERTGLVFTFVGSEGSLGASDCRRRARGVCQVPVVCALPEDPALRRRFAACCDSRSPYGSAVEALFNEVWQVGELRGGAARARRGILHALLGR